MSSATDFMHLHLACSLLKLKDEEAGVGSLTEQAGTALRNAPQMLVDVSEVRLTSMRIGELINLYNAFHRQWDGQPHKFVVLDRSGAGLEVLKRARLDLLFAVAPTLEEAYAALA